MQTVTVSSDFNSQAGFSSSIRKSRQSVLGFVRPYCDIWVIHLSPFLTPNLCPAEVPLSHCIHFRVESYQMWKWIMEVKLRALYPWIFPRFKKSSFDADTWCVPPVEVLSPVTPPPQNHFFLIEHVYCMLTCQCFKFNPHFGQSIWGFCSRRGLQKSRTWNMLKRVSDVCVIHSIISFNAYPSHFSVICLFGNRSMNGLQGP